MTISLVEPPPDVLEAAHRLRRLMLEHAILDTCVVMGFGTEAAHKLRRADESDQMTRIENALRWLVFNALTSGDRIADVDVGEWLRGVDARVTKIMQSGSRYG